MIDCFNGWLLPYEWTTYFKTIMLLSDEISILWGECRPVGTFFPGPGFDSRHGQQFNKQGDKFYTI